MVGIQYCRLNTVWWWCATCTRKRKQEEGVCIFGGNIPFFFFPHPIAFLSLCRMTSRLCKLLVCNILQQVMGVA